MKFIQALFVSKINKKRRKVLIKNNEILVKTLMCGICGSDKKLYRSIIH